MQKQRTRENPKKNIKNEKITVVWKRELRGPAFSERKVYNRRPRCSIPS
jgi:hypothetical protein